MQIGLVGLQFSGKTTLFNTLSKKNSTDLHPSSDEAIIEVIAIPEINLSFGLGVRVSLKKDEFGRYWITGKTGYDNFKRIKKVIING